MFFSTLHTSFFESVENGGLQKTETVHLHQSKLKNLDFFVIQHYLSLSKSIATGSFCGFLFFYHYSALFKIIQNYLFLVRNLVRTFSTQISTHLKYVEKCQITYSLF